MHHPLTFTISIQPSTSWTRTSRRNRRENTLSSVHQTSMISSATITTGTPPRMPDPPTAMCVETPCPGSRLTVFLARYANAKCTSGVRRRLSPTASGPPWRASERILSRTRKEIFLCRTSGWRVISPSPPAVPFARKPAVQCCGECCGVNAFQVLFSLIN